MDNGKVFIFAILKNVMITVSKTFEVCHYYPKFQSL